MAFLERDRWAGARVPFVRIGSRTIRYLKADLENYISSRLRLTSPNSRYRILDMAPGREHYLTFER